MFIPTGKFEDINEYLSAGNTTGTTTISTNPAKSKYKKGVAITSRSYSSNFSWANASKENKTCDSISKDDESGANIRSNYVKKKRSKGNF